MMKWCGLGGTENINLRFVAATTGSLVTRRRAERQVPIPIRATLLEVLIEVGTVLIFDMSCEAK
jgi:hypothetical protein